MKSGAHILFIHKVNTGEYKKEKWSNPNKASLPQFIEENDNWPNYT